MGKYQIVQELRRLADRIEEGESLNPNTERVLQSSLLPALDHLLNEDLDFFAVAAYGEDCLVQDWVNATNAVLFEVSGRLHHWGRMLGELADNWEAGDECEKCEKDGCPDRPVKATVN